MPNKKVVVFTKELHNRMKKDYKESVLPIIEMGERVAKSEKESKERRHVIDFIRKRINQLDVMETEERLSSVSQYYLRCAVTLEKYADIDEENPSKDFHRISMLYDMLAYFTMADFIRTFPPTKWIDKTGCIKDYSTTMQAVEDYLEATGLDRNSRMVNNDDFKTFLLDYRNPLIERLVMKSIFVMNRISKMSGKPTLLEALLIDEAESKKLKVIKGGKE